MNSAFRAALLLFFFCLASVLYAVGSKEVKSAAAQSTVVQVSGRVRLVGSDPFPELVVSGPDREWYIDRDDQSKLKDLQHRTVTVEGIETVKELRFANGRPAGERRTLKNIRIISVE